MLYRRIIINDSIFKKLILMKVILSNWYWWKLY